MYVWTSLPSNSTLCTLPPLLPLPMRPLAAAACSSKCPTSGLELSTHLAPQATVLDSCGGRGAARGARRAGCSHPLLGRRHSRTVGDAGVAAPRSTAPQRHGRPASGASRRRLWSGVTPCHAERRAGAGVPAVAVSGCWCGGLEAQGRAAHLRAPVTYPSSCARSPCNCAVLMQLFVLFTAPLVSPCLQERQAGAAGGRSRHAGVA